MEKAIFDLLTQGYTFDSIQSKLSLTREDMAFFLKSINNKIHQNYNHIKYYENGKRRYSFKELNESSVITELNADYYKTVVISDTHFGSTDENPRYLDIVYNYCIQNDIHNIYHLGDVVDGTSGYQDNKKLKPLEQIEHVINDYPFDKSILNFILLGNHDMDLIGYSENVHDAIIKNRKDMVCLGYGTNELFLKNDSIILKHTLLIDKTITNYNNKIILRGHSHRMKCVNDLNNCLIYAPSLSDLQFVEDTIPGFLVVEFSFFNGYINKCIVNHYGIIDNKLINMNVDRVILRSHTRPEDVQREERFAKIKK